MKSRTVLLHLFLTSLLAYGQSRTSAIGGEVLDPSGNPVPGARITVRDLDRGIARSASAGPAGDYLVLKLELGRYEVQVDHPGFSPVTLTGLQLTLDSEIRLVHKLVIGTDHATVSVTAETVSVDATASAVSGLIDRAKIAELPLIGRDFIQLALLRPGVHTARAQSQDGNNGFGMPLSISGSRPMQNSVRLDGAILTNQTGATPGSLLGVNLGVDAIQEFSVLASSFGATTGRAAGGVIHAVTRSGGNDLHGSLFYFHRDSALDARNFFDGASTAAFRRQQFGGSASGPLRRNQTFLFANAEGLKDSEDRTTINTTLSDSARAGNLTSGPVTVHPSIKPLLDLLPAPNQGVLGDTALYVFSNPNRAREGFVTSRLDHVFSPADSFFLRYTYDDAARRDLTNFALASRNNTTRMHSLSAEQTHIFSPRLLNTARFGWLRSFMTVGGSTAVSTSLDNPAMAFIPGAPGPGIVTVPELSLFEGASGAIDSDVSMFDSYQFYDDLSYHRGRHLIRFGGSAEATVFDFSSSNSALGEFTFSTLSDLLTNKPLRFRAMLPGTDTARLFRQGIFAWYVQDSWRIARRLTLELSVRHEWISVPSEANGKLANLDVLASSTVRTTGPWFRNPSRKNFAPRAGLAWDLRGGGSTVFRAGYGIYHDQILSQFLLISGVRNPPFFLYADARGLAAGGFPANSYAELVSRPNIDLRMERIDPAPPQPYVQHWNASLSQSLPGSLSVQATYAASHGLNLSTIVEDANLVQPQRLSSGQLFFPAGAPKINPAFGFIRNRLFNGHSFYNSLQTLLGWKGAAGLQLQAAFTWSKSIDDDSSTFARTDATNSIGIPVDGVPGFNRGLSGHDVRRHLSIQAVWNLPRPAGSFGSLIGAWRVGSVVTSGSGLPFSATLAYDAARTGTSRPDYRGGQRPDANPAFTGSAVTGDPSRWFLTGAFLRPTPGYLGNLGRNTLTGPSWFSADLNLARDILIREPEGLRLSLRFEAFNLTNHANFALPGGRRSEVFTATAVREDAGRITAAGPARKFQFGLRLEF